jgi:hypothetical protein
MKYEAFLGNHGDTLRRIKGAMLGIVAPLIVIRDTGTDAHDSKQLIPSL